MTEKAVTGAAWSRLFSELTSTIAVDLDGGRVSLEGALSRLSSPDRGERRTAADAVTDALEPGLRTRAFVFNTLLADKAVDDRLRRYPHWLASMNLDNEASDESVRALVAAVQARYDIPQRWYALKARVLGLDRLRRLRPHGVGGGRGVRVRWREAQLVLDATAALLRAPGRGAPILRRGVDRRPRPTRQAPGRLLRTVPSQHPYLR
jgi:oligoendopeptidase F